MKPVDTKQTFITLLGCIAILSTSISLTGCNDRASVRRILNMSLKCLEEKDYRSYVDNLFVDHGFKDQVENERVMAAIYFRDSLENAYQKDGGIVAHQINDIELSDDGNLATANCRITFGNDKKIANKSIRLKLTKEGNWRILMDEHQTWSDLIAKIKQLKKSGVIVHETSYNSLFVPENVQ